MAYSMVVTLNGAKRSKSKIVAMRKNRNHTKRRETTYRLDHHHKRHEITYRYGHYLKRHETIYR